MVKRRETMKQTILIVAALLAGFVGGVLGTRVEHTREQARPEQVVRARSFEMVDGAGRVISYWGIDKRDHAVLAFGSYWPPDKTGRGDGPPTLPPDDPDNQRVVVGVLADSPYVDLRGVDGKTRMRLNLSIYQKPILWMGDETWPRLWLGIQHSDTPGPEDNDWALSFGDSVSIGRLTEEVGGERYVRGFLSVDKNRVKFPRQQTK
jgi:hypothetical protein